jgi:hypothetical protein
MAGACINNRIAAANTAVATVIFRIKLSFLFFLFCARLHFYKNPSPKYGHSPPFFTKEV